MDVARVTALAREVRPVEVGQCTHADVRTLLEASSALRRWLDGVDLAAARRLLDLADTDTTLFPQATLASATRTGQRQADRAMERVATTGLVPEIGEALAEGEVSAAHVDAVTGALKRLEPVARQQFATQGAKLAAIARRSSPDDFARAVNLELRRAQRDEGLALLERQKRDTYLRTWTDRATGMVMGRFAYDPETGLGLLGAIENRLEALFHDEVPDNCPTDPSAKQDHLRALALAHLATHGGGSGRAEITVVIDHETLVKGLHEHSIINTGQDCDLPVETLRRLACGAEIYPAVLGANGVVLDLGRSARLASSHQRRALRAMYDTCAYPGCCVKVRHCEPHHVDPWEHGGSTDIGRLLPLCSRHHHAVHEGRVRLHLAPDRTITITYPDGSVTATGPPRARAA